MPNQWKVSYTQKQVSRAALEFTDKKSKFKGQQPAIVELLAFKAGARWAKKQLKLS